jgi:hypothetical protein
VLVRPNFLFAAPILPVFLAFTGGQHGRKQGVGLGIACVVGVLSMMLGHGLVNQSVGGEFRILPWQGAYNLFYANQPTSNGRYFVQSVSFEHLPAGMNPTRAESEWRYREEVGQDAPLTAAAMQTHWRKRTIETVLGDPQGWFGLQMRKVFYLFNDWEQYNNLSYAYQKARFPVLRWNPMGWGLLVLGVTLVLALGSWRLADRGALVLVLGVVVAYALGLLLFFISARFRLPMAPLLCVGIGGLVWMRMVWKERMVRTDWRQWLLPGVGILAAGVLAYGNWFGAQDQRPFVEDAQLIASAAMKVGEDATAIKYAREVLEQDPARQSIRRILLASLFNQWISDGKGEDGASLLRQMQEVADGLELDDASTLFIRGVLAWKQGDAVRAREIWEYAHLHYGPAALWSMRALAALGWADGQDRGGFELQQIREILGQPDGGGI